MVKPQVNFVAGKERQNAQTGEGEDWTEVVQQLVPIEIDRFETVNGSIHYYDFNSDPKVDIYLSNVDALIRNLNNSGGDGKERLAKLKAHALAINHADVNLNLNVDPFAKKPDFNFDLRLLHLQMARIREYFKAIIDTNKQMATAAQMPARSATRVAVSDHCRTNRLADHHKEWERQQKKELVRIAPNHRPRRWYYRLADEHGRSVHLRLPLEDRVPGLAAYLNISLCRRGDLLVGGRRGCARPPAAGTLEVQGPY